MLELEKPMLLVNRCGMLGRRLFIRNLLCLLGLLKVVEKSELFVLLLSFDLARFKGIL